VVVNYDESFSHKKTAQWLALVHDIMAADDIDPNYDIDIGIDTVLANAATHSSSGMCIIPMLQWYELSLEEGELWQSLSEADQAIILGSSPKTSQSPLPWPPKSSSGGQRPSGWNAPNQHLSSFLSEIAIEDEDPVPIPTDTSDTPDPSLVEPNTVHLANVMKQKRTWTQPHSSDLPPSNIQKVLSNDSNHKNTKPDTAGQKEIVVDGTCYWAVNVVCFYTISSMHHTTASWSLFDHSANGGIAGDDVHIIECTMPTVNVHGIDNHEVTGIPIVTDRGVVKTQHGPVITILLQYAYLGSGKTIHSATQLEHYQNDVNDHSIKVNGELQCILTLDGYVIPINNVGGLCYISMCPYTDDEWDHLPHVILMSDLDWDPTVLDHTLDDDEHW
jgi:hypothetical protein